ncbi:TetR/AcrR family transcriptional regulator [Streptomyces clavuligerus]|uniref:TetR family transcriptional regulator n=1 Tax=Streptomyces clavuligerus TaxID=1901 RepID=B5H0J1_STRCL|nr:TetR/AcrR family transcriptional regulator [Streptomyces clavuligerus]ANW18880.1 TetR family transcriptional regulator [Streptomyces clavuligerus]AXU13455.1 TetR family transcriptional regulator [Streptomyces clavuligerus]EDY52087.1 tetR family transcriptional regulatory protein [Streptomyces clavuligerus]EFG08419.1 TetR family transcriptional regulator [Streptomyces clavuligerus]MBY6303414.1 TetR/AcrR family transcriptional regulator C-terminal domain-containing protein [Streptomyces clavu
MTTETSGTGDLSRTLELLWGTAERPTRGPKPGLSLDRIVAAAVAVADTEGLDAVSMRRIATELGTGTMTLYRYVPGKAELLDLMLDRVTDPGPVPPERPGGPDDWRQAVRVLARGFLDLYQAHPWMLKVNNARTVLGPSGLRSLELALAGLRSTGLRDPEQISVIVMVQSFVTGIARSQAESAEALEATGQTEEEFWAQQSPYLERAMRSGVYPLTASLSEDAFSDTGLDYFTFGLERLLDGLEALVERRRAERAASGAADGPGGTAASNDAGGSGGTDTSDGAGGSDGTDASSGADGSDRAGGAGGRTITEKAAGCGPADPAA